jgi:hypothetical protein
MTSQLQEQEWELNGRSEFYSLTAVPTFDEVTSDKSGEAMTLSENLD